MQAIVTHSTNTLDAFARAHLGSDDDVARSRLIALNRDYFTTNQTFWLPVGAYLWIDVPEAALAEPVYIDGELLIIGNAEVWIL